MTQTIYEFEGKHTCYIYADYGHGKKRLSKIVTITKLSTAAALQHVENFMDMGESADADDYKSAWHMAQTVLEQLSRSTTGNIYQVDDGNGNVEFIDRFHATYAAARSQCLSERC